MAWLWLWLWFTNPCILGAFFFSTFVVFGWDSDLGFTYALMLILSAVALWVIGDKFNGDLEYYDAPHLFMHVRLQYCGLFYLIAIPSYFIS